MSKSGDTQDDISYASAGSDANWTIGDLSQINDGVKRDPVLEVDEYAEIDEDEDDSNKARQKLMMQNGGNDVSENSFEKRNKDDFAYEPTDSGWPEDLE